MSTSSSSRKKVAGATYTETDASYFEKRTLKRSAGVWGLWGLAVAAVISGDFSGWNFGIGFAGFGGMLIAFVILVIMYYGLTFSIGEMAAAMPHTGGAYSFARSAMGPWGGWPRGWPRRSSTSPPPRRRVLLGPVRRLGARTADRGEPARLRLVDHPVRAVHRSQRRGGEYLVRLRDHRLDHLDRHHRGLRRDGADVGRVRLGLAVEHRPTDGNTEFLPFGVGSICWRAPSRCGSPRRISAPSLPREESTHAPPRTTPLRHPRGLWPVAR